MEDATVNWEPVRQAENPLARELARREATGELVPGASATLSGLWSDLRNRDEAVIASEVEMRLAKAGKETIIASLRDPAHKARREHPLKSVLARYGDRLKDVESTFAAWAGELATLTGPALTAAVVKRLGDRQNNDHLRDPIPLPGPVQSIAATLRTHFPEVRPDRVETLAEQLYRDCRGRVVEEGELVRIIAGRLRTPSVARGLLRDGQPLPRDDWRISASRQIASKTYSGHEGLPRW